jgi:hypothetical protein
MRPAKPRRCASPEPPQRCHKPVTPATVGQAARAAGSGGVARGTAREQGRSAITPKLHRPSVTAREKAEKHQHFRRCSPARRTQPRGMPVHSHHRPKGLEPKRVRKAAQQLVAPIVMDDRFADHRAEAGHSVGEPSRNLPAMQRHVGAASSVSHRSARLQAPLSLYVMVRVHWLLVTRRRECVSP